MLKIALFMVNDYTEVYNITNVIIFYLNVGPSCYFTLYSLECFSIICNVKMLDLSIIVTSEICA